MFEFKSVHDANVKGKRVFVRCDFDVPIADGKIIDNSRLISSLDTIKFLLDEGATVIAAGHIGRPEKEDPKLSTEVIAKWLTRKFPDTDLEKVKMDDLKGFKLNDKFFVLENLRFDPGEEENDEDFAKSLGALADIYVNEAFGVSHRSHASITGVAKLLPHYGGFHLRREVKVLTRILNEPKRPLTFIIGGAKIETKLPLISKMHRFADFVLVGGELAEQTKILAEEQHKKIVGQKAMLLVADLTEDKFDITPTGLENFAEVVARSETIVWNGPMGFIEKGYIDGTIGLAKVINSSNAYKVIGGGDTIGFLNNKKLLDKFDFISMGGGAMLEFLSGEKLPGLLVLEN